MSEHYENILIKIQLLDEIKKSTEKAENTRGHLDMRLLSNKTQVYRRIKINVGFGKQKIPPYKQIDLCLNELFSKGYIRINLVNGRTTSLNLNSSVDRDQINKAHAVIQLTKKGERTEAIKLLSQITGLDFY